MVRRIRACVEVSTHRCRRVEEPPCAGRGTRCRFFRLAVRHEHEVVLVAFGGRFAGADPPPSV
ncbi:hypothetical protein CSW53_27155 (plasmid) [Rhodococcus ruber]|nr:hypothetical protein CSW53_27155 [Rhodococcus ruber]